MSRRRMTMGEVAPSRAATPRNLEKNGQVWLLNLDQIEPHTGALLSKQMANSKVVGNSTNWFDESNVLYSKLRPYLNKVYLPNDGGLCTTELVPLKPDTKLITREYLAHYLRSESFLRWVNEQVDGAKMPRVSMKIFWEHEIALPSIEEQKRITTILNKADSLRRKRQQAIQFADNILRATFLDMFGDPGTNPKHWPVGSIRDLVTSVNYGTSEKADETTGEYPILRMMNITYEGRWNFDSLKYIDLSENDKEKYLAKPGDLLFNRTNSKELVGKAAVFEENREMAIAGYLIRVRTNNKANPYYISAYLNSKHGKQTLYAMCKSIVGMANINAQELQDIRIQIPPIELQNEYAKIIAAMRKRELLMRSSESQLAELFASLNNQFFLN